ncbi:hypothetical protein HNY73_000139 [Argiope bruennichi]|uniref:Uncharacterized protein n=1 Tax=Argiope bruennichi TaxID=94029 RepID=A0A8T0FX41_ARGBR|nr:hypothetical protein HNY73_000139 [Argiope bruennichi]
MSPLQWRESKRNDACSPERYIISSERVGWKALFTKTQDKSAEEKADEEEGEANMGVISGSNEDKFTRCRPRNGCQREVRNWPPPEVGPYDLVKLLVRVAAAILQKDVNSTGGRLLMVELGLGGWP